MAGVEEEPITIVKCLNHRYLQMNARFFAVFGGVVAEPRPIRESL
jgi:hypothetical protein